MDLLRRVLFAKRDDDDELVDLKEYILGDVLYTNIVMENTPYEKYVTKASKLVQNIAGWSYNRVIDEVHVKDLAKSLRNMKHPHFVGSIKLARTSSNLKLRLLDGQHRLAAVSALMKDNGSFDMDIDVDVYVVDGDEDIEMCELFIKANANKNVDVDDIPDAKIIETINTLIEFWPESIKTDEDKRACRPNVHKRVLYNALKKVMDKHADCAPRILARKVFAMNETIKGKSLVDIFGTEHPTKTQMAIYEKARKKDFFLNMDCIYHVDKWTNLL